MARKKKKPAKGNGEKKKRGFALLTPEQRAERGRRGAKKAHARGTAHQWTPEEARRAANKLWREREQEEKDNE